MLKAVDQGVVTRSALLDAGFASLREEGYARTTARGIAERAGVNQALVFYHFGGVQQLLVAALDRSAQERLERYRQETAPVRDPVRLLAVARALHREDVECGHTTALAELSAAALGNDTIRQVLAARTGAWLDFTESVIRQALAAGGLADLLPVAALARAILALQLGADLLGRLNPASDWIDDAFAAADMFAALATSDA